MKFYMKVTLSAVFLLSCFIGNAQDHPQRKSSATSALATIDLIRSVQKGEKLTDADWEKLFSTDGFKCYFERTAAKGEKQMIKNAIILCFDKTKQSERDSLLALPLGEVDSRVYNLMVVHNFYKLSTRLDEVEEFLKNTDFESMMDKAQDVVKTFLPPEAGEAEINPFNLYLIATLGEAKVSGSFVFMDMNYAKDLSDSNTINLLAHEYHHNYRGIGLAKMFESNPPAQDILLVALNEIHREGTADLIDKPSSPMEEMDYPASLINAYLQDLKNTPAKLKQIDLITQNYLEEQTDETKKAYNEIGSMIKFGGHSNGYYMATLIKNQLGIEPIIKTYADIQSFIKLYNEAAKKAGNEYVFSDIFINHVDRLFKGEGK